MFSDGPGIRGLSAQRDPNDTPERDPDFPAARRRSAPNKRATSHSSQVAILEQYQGQKHRNGTVQSAIND